MVSVTDISVGISSLKTAFEIAKAMREITDATERNSKILELQSAIMDAQASAIQAREAHAAQIDRIRDLETEVARLKTWDAEKQRYELKDLGNGALAYTLKADAQPAEPAHSICPDCYQAGIKSILQQVTRFPGRADVRVCQNCGWEVYVQGGWEPEHAASKSSSRKRR